MFTEWIQPALQDLWSSLTLTVFPMRCSGCGAEGSYLCQACAVGLPVPEQHCLECGAVSALGLTHPRCQRPWAARGCFVALSYKSPAVSKAIVEGKYYLVSGVFTRLGELTASRLRFTMPELLTGELLVVPVPLHVRRQRWRGFNQSEIASSTLADTLELTVQNVLERTVHTKVQKDLHRQQRLENVRGVFRVTNTDAIAGKRILLVDDVTTTGATLREATNALMSAGAAEVFCVALARE